jgi:hypothetical protein
MGSRTIPICPGQPGGPFSLSRTPRTSGVGLRPLMLLEAGVGLATSALLVAVVVSSAAVSVVVVEEFAASKEAVAPPPVSSPAAVVVAGVVELCSAPLPPPSSGVWAPAPRQRSRRHAGASGISTPPNGPSAGALAPAPSPFLSRREPDLRVPAPRHLRWGVAGGLERRQGSGAHGWGLLPAAGPPGRPRPGSASTPGLMTAMPGPRTGP